MPDLAGHAVVGGARVMSQPESGIQFAKFLTVTTVVGSVEFTEATCRLTVRLDRKRDCWNPCALLSDGIGCRACLRRLPAVCHFPSGHNRNVNLREDPIPLLIRQLAVPAGVGMLFSTLLNVVDTFYAGMLSPTALAALSLAGPLFFLVLTLGIGIGQATNALVGNRLGADDEPGAQVLAMQAIAFAMLVSFVSATLAYIYVPEAFVAMGGEPPYLAEGIEYMRVVLLGTAFFALSFVVNGVLNTRGDTKSYRNAQIVGFFANILLDPLFMFGFGLGVTGVAVATVLIQAGVFAYLLTRMLKLDFMQGVNVAMLKPNLASFRELLSQSLPTSASMGLVAVGSIIIVAYVTRFGESAMAAYGVALRLEQIILLPVIGINIAALSLTGVNYGAGHWERVREIYKTGVLYALSLMVVGGVMVLLFGSFFMSLFTDDPDVQSIGVTYLRFEAFILPAYAVTFLSAAVLQGLKKPLIALYFNVARQVVGQLLLFWLAIDLLGLDITGIWWSVLGLNWVLAVLIYAVVRQNLNRDQLKTASDIANG